VSHFRFSSLAVMNDLPLASVGDVDREAGSRRCVSGTVLGVSLLWLLLHPNTAT
jgi:hypothetical protein